MATRRQRGAEAFAGALPPAAKVGGLEFPPEPYHCRSQPITGLKYHGQPLPAGSMLTVRAPFRGKRYNCVLFSRVERTKGLVFTLLPLDVVADGVYALILRFPHSGHGISWPLVPCSNDDIDAAIARYKSSVDRKKAVSKDRTAKRRARMLELSSLMIGDHAIVRTRGNKRLSVKVTRINRNAGTLRVKFGGRVFSVGAENVLSVFPLPNIPIQKANP